MASPSDADEPLIHGGDLAAARRLFPGAPEPFLDLSTGINPTPYPVPPLAAELFAKLPDSVALDRLTAAAARTYGAASAGCVVAAPGTQILLPLVAGLVSPGPAAVLTPTYGEHARAAALAGHAVVEAADLNIASNANLVVVTNPNNPDGRLFARSDLLSLAKKLRAGGGLLVVDEAFMDVAPRDLSLAADTAHGNIVVLRSFGKFFGLAGLRLGFALAAPPMVTRLKTMLGPWAVSAAALTIGTQALADDAWIAATRRSLAAGAARLDAVLQRNKLDIAGGTALFRLVRTPHACALFHGLGRAGIWTRTFAEQPDWLRFGLPGTEAGWERFASVMAAFAGVGS